MNAVCILYGILFTGAGVLFATGKLHGYIRAWKQMPEEEKARIRIRPLCRNIGEVIGLSGILFLLKGVWPGFQDHWFTGAMIAWLVVAGFDVFYIERSNRYLNNQYKKE